MPLPFKVSTLLYVFDPSDRILLIHRKREPNRGLWSPPGGKLDTANGESPYACACREAGEELGLRLRSADLHLTGVISERGYAGTTHWLMFLFEVEPRISGLPPPIDEGHFAFFERSQLASLPIPESDRNSIWPLFWRHRRGLFAANCDCQADGNSVWSLEESRERQAPLDSLSQ